MDAQHEGMIQRLRDFFASRDEFLFVWLFGSMATGKYNRYSDVDIAVYVKDEKLVRNIDWYLDLKVKLMDITKREVDLVILNIAKPIVKHAANMKKRVLSCSDPVFEAEYSLRIIKEYNDVRYWANKTRAR